MAGLKYSYDIQSKSRARIVSNNLRIAPNDFQFEIGAGVQMFFPFFIFSPEIKFSHGLGNILIFQNGLRESSVIEKLISQTFTISFHFEGWMCDADLRKLEVFVSFAKKGLQLWKLQPLFFT